MSKAISPKWSRLALSVLGNKDGRHCHWCEFIDTDDGEAYCLNKDSLFCDGDRIRTWDECAARCKLFKLDSWYMDDKNHERYLGVKK